VQPTKDAIEELTNGKGIPVVSGSLTGNGFANPDVDHKVFAGFARVVPDNDEQAAALSSFDKGLDLRRAVLVEDRRVNDDYISSLREAFESRMANSPNQPMPFVSRGPDAEGSLSSEFARMATNICASTPEIDTVYFAGRPTHLRQFVNALAARRPCVDRPFTVVSGSDASTLYSDDDLLWNELLPDPRTGRREVTVEYTSLSDPGAWTAGQTSSGGSAQAFAKLRSLVGQARTAPVGPVGQTDIGDSRTVTSYDSAWTAITGIRIHTEGSRLPDLRDIGDDWDSLQGLDKVDGAGGWICLDAAGNPYNKAVAVVRLDPQRRSPHFVGLAWPEGAPPPKDPRGNGFCPIPK
jgi:ABC-type branched-subunit amino acid transport system substrate-binding protein